MSVPTKLKNFAWRACSGSLPVKCNLLQRHVICTSCCERCDREDEDVLHCLVRCPDSDVAWIGSSLLDWCRRNAFLDIKQLVLDLEAAKGMEGVQEFFLHNWVAWTCRNKFVFEPGFTNFDVVCIGFAKMVFDYPLLRRARDVAPIISSVAAAHSWLPPEGGILKLNVDAAVLNNEIGSL